MTRISIILTVLFLALFKVTSSCDCDFEGDFFTVAPKTNFVALIKVTKYLSFKDIQNTKTPMSMQVEIIKIYKGKESRKFVKVWGDNGVLCRPYLSEFTIGQTYVMAFFKGDPEQGQPKERITDYCISFCGIYYLRTFLKDNTMFAISEFANNPPDTVNIFAIENLFKTSFRHDKRK